jgi:apolipoprotein N-acyltransferase
VVAVLPESLALLSPLDAQAAARDVAELARTRQALIVVGLGIDGAPGEARDRALVASPDGTIAWYDKQHLVPGLEDAIRPGRSRLIFQAFGARAGVAICKDMHFAQLGRGYGAARTQLMLVPANDFVRDAWLSDRITVLRGVEGGYAIARAARQGVSSVSDRNGRILAQAASSAQSVTVVHARVPIPDTTEPTPYVRFGDLFGWSCVAAWLALALGWRLFRSRRSGGSRPREAMDLQA